MIRQWGFSMAGCEGAILAGMTASLDAIPGPARYVEIGVARGDTFGIICEALAQEGRLGQAIAIDLPDGAEAEYARPASCFCPEAFRQNAEIFGDKVQLVRAVSHEWLRGPAGPFTLVLIDGCHEQACMCMDFEAVEPHVVPGGIVIVHDTAPWSQEDPSATQPHRGEPLRVRAALEELRLLQDQRPGWRLLTEAPGLQAEGGRGCMVFQKDVLIVYSQRKGGPSNAE